jgi:murein DD-endopeptidase MepM/ murein hydrolase activator NlpD
MPDWDSLSDTPLRAVKKPQRAPAPDWDTLVERDPAPEVSQRKKPAPVKERSWTEAAQDLAERAAMQVGIIDPATYYGRGNYGEDAVAPTARPVATNVAPRSWLDRAGDAVTNTRERTGIAPTIGRTIADAVDIDRGFKIQNTGKQGEVIEQMDDAGAIAREKEARAVIAAREAADPTWREDGSILGNVGRFGAEVVGNMIGDVSPLDLLGPGKTVLGRMAAQGTINAGVDASVQSLDVQQGMRDNIDAGQVATNFAAGAALQGSFEGFGALRNWWKGRGVDASTMGDEDLALFTLEETGADALELDATLRSGGAAPEQFSSPEIAARMAERIRAAQATQPMNLAEGLPVKTGNTAKRFNTQLDEVINGVDGMPAPNRVVPEEVTMQAAPEGTVRSDDFGGQAGLERKRAADDNVLSQALEAVKIDPVVGEILNSNVSPQTKIATVYSRLQERNAATRDSLDDPIDGVPTQEELAQRTGLNDLQKREPWQRSTASEAGQGPISYQAPFADDKVTSGFGRRVAPKAGASTNHKGTDYGVPVGTPIRPIADGEVIFAGKRGGYGNHIKVRHDDGTVSSYSHLSGIGVKAGQRVGRDSNMGASGMSGTATGPHLHLEIERNGQKIDPSSVFRGNAEPPVMRGAPERPADWADNPAEGAAERTEQQASPSEGEFDDGSVFQDRDGIFGERRRGAQQYESPMGTGNGTNRGQPFKEVGDDPDGNPGFWESEASRMQEEFRARAKAREDEAKASAGSRFNEERARTADPKDSYGGYDQKPEQADGFWRTTEDGYVAGKGGKPVAFRNAREAAKWAAQNKMGGDFELHSYGTSKRGQEGRVVLKKRANSTYGTKGPEAEAAPEADAPDAGTGTGFKQPQGFERTVPPAGRSADASQRAIGGEVDPTAPRAPEASPEAPQPAAAPFVGAKAGDAAAARPTEKVVTANGKTEIDTEFEVVDAKDLITSSDAGFDQTLQPRDRGGRRTSDAQIADRAANLDAGQLGRSRLASSGAPIVGPNNMVESGNGRTSFIRRAYDTNPEGSAKYRAMIDEMGFDTAGMERPVLIRRRKTEMSPEDLRRFTVDSQDAGVMRMSAAELADADAKAIDADLMKLYKGGDPAAAGNADFARAYAAKVVSSDDLNAMTLADGTLSADGAKRLRGALTQRAYGDQRFLEKITQDEDTDIKAIGNVLVDVAGELGRIKDRIAEGELPKEFDIAPQLKEIANLISKSRSEGTPLNDLLEQSDIFSGDVDPMTKELAGIMMKGDGYSKPRSAAEMKKGLQTFLRDAADAKKDMLGGDMKQRAIDMARAARVKTEGQGDMFGGRAKSTGDVRGTKATVAKLDDELLRLSRSSPNRRYRELASQLRKLVDDKMTVEYGPQGLVYKRTKGEADPETGQAFVKNRGDQETILHEAIHVTAMSRYGWEFEKVRDGDAGAPHARELLKLYDEAKRVWGRSPRNTMASELGETVRNGLENVDEFLAYSLTSPKMQKWMERGTLFDRFADGLRKLFGLEPRFKPLLQRVVRAGTDLLDAASIDGQRSQVKPFGRAEPVETRPRPQSKEPEGMFSKLADKVVDLQGLRGDVDGFKAAVGSPVSTLKKFTEPMGRMISAGMFTNDARLRGMAGKFKSLAIEELANHFHSRAGGNDAVGRDYHMATMRAATSRSQRAFDALGDMADDKLAMSRIRDLLTNPKATVRAKPEEAAAAREIAKILKETIEYRKDAGEDIGEVTDGYFPRIMDVEAVVKGRDKFLAAAEKLYSGIGAPDPKASAAAWYDRLFDTYAGLDGGLDHVSGANGGVGTSSAKAREFGKQADVLLKDFYNQDVFGSLAAYFTGSAKRAEFNRRFGKPGREGSPERLKWVKEHGDKTQWDDLVERMKADVRASGEDPAGFERIIQNVMKSNLGQMGSTDPFARNAVSYLHAWNQLGKMDRSLVTSLGELTMGFIRGGPKYGFTFMKDSVGEFARQIRKAEPSDAARWAEAIGVANDAMVNQVLTSRIDAEASVASVQKMLAGFYKGIGLHQYTEATRIAGVKMGRKFISNLAHDLNSSSARTRNRADFYLKELGIKDPAAFGKQLRAAEPKMQDVLEDKGGIASDYGTALNRFINQTIMMPSRAEKPTWAAHPVGSLMFSLMSYSYGFKKNVLDRGGRLAIEGIKAKDPTMLLPAMSLSIMVAFQALNDTYLRPYLFGSNYDFSTETPTEFMMRVSDRAGLTGALSPIVNAIKAVKYDRSLLESLSGPVIGSIGNAVQKVAVEPFTDRNSPNTNTAERNAAAAFYDAVIDPMTDAFAASRLKGIVRSAGILGTGNKKGGLLPADRDMVVDEIAGEKEEK